MVESLMSTARNDITGDSIQSKPSSDLYRDNWERIFGKKDESQESASSTTDRSD